MQHDDEEDALYRNGRWNWSKQHNCYIAWLGAVEQSQARAEALANDLYGRETDGGAKWARVADKVERTRARVAAAQAEHGPRVLVPYYGSARGGRPLSRPVGTLTTHDRYALVDGDRLRMLSVDEQRAAMGFPPSYPLTGTRAEQVHQLGNAVCPPVAAHVVRQLLESTQ